MDSVECGYTAPLPRRHHFDNITDKHISLRTINFGSESQELHPRQLRLQGHQVGLPPTQFRDTQQFEQLSVKRSSGASASTDTLTGKPARKEEFTQCCWKRCAIGTREDHAEATTHQEWEVALQHGNPRQPKNRNDVP